MVNARVRLPTVGEHVLGAREGRVTQKRLATFERAHHCTSPTVNATDMGTTILHDASNLLTFLSALTHSHRTRCRTSPTWTRVAVDQNENKNESENEMARVLLNVRNAA